MKKLIVVIFLTSIIALGEQQAITDNGVKILLKDDNTWRLVEQPDSALRFEPFATTEDSHRIFIDGSVWYFVTNEDSLRSLLGENKEYEILPYYRLETKPKLIKKPPMIYPEEARKTGIEGVVVVKMLVDIDGTVIETEILRSSGDYVLDQAALRAAEQALFEPAAHHGVPVRVWVSMPFRYKLPGCSGCIF